MENKNKNKNKQILENIQGLESLKKKSFSSSELRSGDQMMNRLKRMQELDFSKKITEEQNRLRSTFEDGFNLFDNVVNIPKKVKVKGGFF